MSDGKADHWDALASLLQVTKGHFEFESGYHGELWFDLERLFRNPDAVKPLSIALAERIAPFDVEIICGPLVEGAYVAMQVASELGVEFAYTERHVRGDVEGLFPVDYTLPGVLREMVHGKRVALVNDIISAGSAIRGSLANLRACSAEVIAIGALANLGDTAVEFAAEEGLPLESLASRPAALYTVDQCPMCATGTALVPHPGS